MQYDAASVFVLVCVQADLPVERRVLRLPPVLIILVDRALASADLGVANHAIALQFRDEDMSLLFGVPVGPGARVAGSTLYNMVAHVDQAGATGAAGHYTATALHACRDRPHWVLFNDTVVSTDVAHDQLAALNQLWLSRRCESCVNVVCTCTAWRFPTSQS